MTKLYGIIVLYNKSADDSKTFGCLSDEKDINIIVCDNSTKDFGNRDIVEKHGYHYISMNGNKGLSKAYNKAIDLIQSENPQMAGYLCLFDDDTFIPKEYFLKLRENTEKGSADILLPIVKDEIGTLSPSVMKKYYCHRAPEDIYSIPENELCGINSGMAVKLDNFINYRYNEDIFLDYVDHNLIRDMRKENKKTEIMDVEIQQTFSSNTDSKEKSMIRFNIFRKDINVFYRKGLGNRFFYHYVILRRKMQLSRKFKDPRIMFR